MNVIREYVVELTDDVRVQILKDWEIFEREGSIGESALRHHARWCLGGERQHGFVPIVRLMHDLVFEINRYYAHGFLAAHGFVIPKPLDK